LMDFLYTENENSIRLVRSVVLKRIFAPIHIWWTQEAIDLTGDPPCNWATFTTGGVHTEIVDGNHETIVRDPYIHKRIIRALQELTPVAWTATRGN